MCLGIYIVVLGVKNHQLRHCLFRFLYLYTDLYCCGSALRGFLLLYLMVKIRAGARALLCAGL
jgi:hypothetical protein